MVRKKIREYRGDSSQTTMAKKYNVSQQTWSYWELAKRTPSVVMMKRLENDSGIPMEELFHDVFNNHRLETNIGKDVV